MTERFESPIAPTVGRVVLVRGGAILPHEPNREVPGLVTRVHSENRINIHAFNDSPGGLVVLGACYDGEGDSKAQATWRWIPYQLKTSPAEPEKSPPTAKVEAAPVPEEKA